jgi:hypothetical protein
LRSDSRGPHGDDSNCLYCQAVCAVVELKVWRGTRLAIGISVANLFNQGATVSEFPVETEAGSAIVVSEDDFFAGRFDVGQAMATQKINTDARFLLANAFQEPRTARIMLRWIF